MPFGRKDTKVEIGTIKILIKIALYFVSVLITMSLMIMPFIKKGSIGYYIIVLTLIINVMTIVAICGSLCIIKNKEKTFRSKINESSETRKKV